MALKWFGADRTARKEERMTEALLNVTEFCQHVGIGRSKYYELVGARRGPRTIRLSETSRALIPASEVREWPERVATELAGSQHTQVEVA
jgi:predicted DNA-binding transcriptional regulator AlpA